MMLVGDLLERRHLVDDPVDDSLPRGLVIDEDDQHAHQQQQPRHDREQRREREPRCQQPAARGVVGVHHGHEHPHRGHPPDTPLDRADTLPERESCPVHRVPTWTRINPPRPRSRPWCHPWTSSRQASCRRRPMRCRGRRLSALVALGRARPRRARRRIRAGGRRRLGPLAVELALERLASRASFLAQPEPLNTMAGAERARFIGPPQRSHAAGPGADIPWITSTTWPHDSQT